MYDTSFQPAGFSPYAGITTDLLGDTTSTNPATAVTQGPDTSGLCTLCTNPTTRPVIFVGGVILIVLAWHFHVLSMIE